MAQQCWLYHYPVYVNKNMLFAYITLFTKNFKNLCRPILFPFFNFKSKLLWISTPLKLRYFKKTYY